MPSLPDLLAAATPRPWEALDTDEPHAVAWIGWTTPEGEINPVAEAQEIDAQASTDIRLIVYAVNLLEAHAAVAEAARLVEAYHDAGGNEWWKAHDDLYAALARLAEAEKEQGT